jgi:hypothetical protein
MEPTYFDATPHHLATEVFFGRLNARESCRHFTIEHRFYQTEIEG